MEFESKDDQTNCYVEFEANLRKSTSFLGFGILYPKDSAPCL